MRAGQFHFAVSARNVLKFFHASTSWLTELAHNGQTWDLKQSRWFRLASTKLITCHSHLWLDGALGTSTRRANWMPLNSRTGTGMGRKSLKAGHQQPRWWHGYDDQSRIYLCSHINLHHGDDDAAPQASAPDVLGFIWHSQFAEWLYKQNNTPDAREIRLRRV